MEFRISRGVRNLETLVPVFELHKGKLERTGLVYDQREGVQTPPAKDLSDASVNLQRINARLRWCASNGNKIADASEPESRAVCNVGVIAYNNSHAPMSLDWTFRDIAARACKKTLGDDPEFRKAEATIIENARRD